MKYLNTAPVGVFDSGVGGVSTLRELARVMPGEDLIYYGDIANAPYGTKTREEIVSLSLSAAHTLMDMGVKELVIACNTATSASAALLRAQTDMAVIGIEPAVKPAASAVSDGLMLVMATPATVQFEKLRLLVERYGRNTRLLACPGLMEFAERMEFESPALDEHLRDLFAPYAGEKIDACVLGCTHYPFLKKAISKALPGVPLFDGNLGTARQARRVLEERGLLSPRTEGGKVTFLSSSGETAGMKYLFELPYTY